MFKVPEDYIIILKFSKFFALILWILDTIYITTSYPKYIFNVYTNFYWEIGGSRSFKIRGGGSGTVETWVLGLLFHIYPMFL